MPTPRQYLVLYYTIGRRSDNRVKERKEVDDTAERFFQISYLKPMCYLMITAVLVVIALTCRSLSAEWHFWKPRAQFLLGGLASLFVVERWRSLIKVTSVHTPPLNLIIITDGEANGEHILDWTIEHNFTKIVDRGFPAH